MKYIKPQVQYLAKIPFLAMCRWTTAFRQNQPNLDRSKLRSTLANILVLSSDERHYCFSCNVLCDSLELGNHESHDIKNGVSDMDITQPTRLLFPVDNRKSQAVSFIASIHIFKMYLHV